MKTTDDLFVLIKSLTKTEKRYFKIYTSKGKDSSTKHNYLKLFDAIEKQKTYNEEEVIATFSDSKFIKHLPSEKNYLYNLILKTLHLYHSASDDNIKAAELLHYSEILYSRGLFNQSEKLIDKYKKVALTHEMPVQLIKSTRHRIALSLQSSKNSKKLERELIQTIHDSKLALEKIQNLQEYRELYVQFLLLIRKEGEYIRNDSGQSKFTPILNHRLMSDESLALTNDAKAIFHYISNTYQYIIGEGLESNYNYYSELTQKEAFDLSEETRRLSNFCEICIKMGKYSDAMILLEKMKSLPAKSFLEKGKQFYRYYDNLLSLYNQTGEFEKAEQLVTTVKTGIKQYETVIHKSKIISLYFHFAYSYFGVKDYKNALQQIHYIVNDPSDLRRDILCHTRMLQLMIYLETNDMLSIEHLVKSSRYFFSTREKLYKYEEALFSFFKRIYLITDEKEKAKLYTRLHLELTAISRPFTEKEINFYTHQINWIESKISNSCFVETLKSNHNLFA
ncbi:hypothetical protein NAT51_05145 [Flavobacterium amniphilum]|uniref:hypothetical protein n=1 Tax=Flavobacterium amniphilum TaxID=1834035 RepID=UPI00202AAA4A|nr:hypothetical protein [Flavobacterium amniphilum]MCL9804894.1 hypothetical protein [Flavobacterium amniphilum]